MRLHRITHRARPKPNLPAAINGNCVFEEDCFATLGCRKALEEAPGAARTAGKGVRSPRKLTAVTSSNVSGFSATFASQAWFWPCAWTISSESAWRPCGGAGVPEPSLRLREVTKLGSGRDRARVHSGRQAASSGSKAFQGSVRQQHPVPLHGVGVRPPGAGALSCP